MAYTAMTTPAKRLIMMAFSPEEAMSRKIPKTKLTDVEKLDLCKAAEQRFWDKVDRRGRDECWPWRSTARSGFGYGAFRAKYPAPTMNAHRIAYMLTFGLVPPGHFVLHTCDNPACCNPSHLTAGTPKDNMRDLVERGRLGDARRFGVDNGNAKLTPEQVLEIRASTLGTVALARQYGVTRDTIRDVRIRKNWKHL